MGLLLDFPVFPHTKPRLREAPQEPPADFPVKPHLMGEGGEGGEGGDFPQGPRPQLRAKPLYMRRFGTLRSEQNPQFRRARPAPESTRPAPLGCRGGGASLKQGKNCWNTPQIFGILVRRIFFENRVFFAPNFKGFSSIYVDLGRFVCTLASIPKIVGEHSNLRQSCRIPRQSASTNPPSSKECLSLRRRPFADSEFE